MLCEVAGAETAIPHGRQPIQPPLGVAVDDAGAEDDAAGAAPEVPEAAAAAASGVANMRAEMVAVSWFPPLNGPVDDGPASAPAAAFVLVASCKLSTTSNRFIDARRLRYSTICP